MISNCFSNSWQITPGAGVTRTAALLALPALRGVAKRLKNSCEFAKFVAKVLRFPVKTVEPKEFYMRLLRREEHPPRNDGKAFLRQVHVILSDPPRGERRIPLVVSRKAHNQWRPFTSFRVTLTPLSSKLGSPKFGIKYRHDSTGECHQALR